MKYVERVKKFYTLGYGIAPKKRFTDEDIDSLVEQGKLTEEEADEIKGSRE